MKNNALIKKLINKRTKIIATLGPATDSPTRIKSLMNRGVDVFRVNFSHGDHQTHRQTIQKVREAADALSLYTAVLADLCGPKIRTGIFEGGQIQLENGQEVIVTTRDVMGKADMIPSQYKKLHLDMKAGERILLDDGKIELLVEHIEGRELRCRVTYGGLLKDKKGMNLPDTAVSSSSLTEKDKQDLQLAIECHVDFIALSFVRSAEDIIELKDYMARFGVDIPVIAKIERPEAVTNIEAILQQAYGIMIARGDLGIEVAAEKLPLLQNKLIDLARLQHRPVIVATQMMESMIENARPTRAEIGDVANAAMHSADAVMLSGETSVGKYPLQAVDYMYRTLRETEQSSLELLKRGDRKKGKPGLREAMSHAALSLAVDLPLKALVVPTRSATTARIVSSYRPAANILGVSHNEDSCRKMALHWGVTPLHLNPLDFRDWRGLTSRIAQNHGILKEKDQVLVVSGFEEKEEDSEPVLKLLTLK